MTEHIPQTERVETELRVGNHSIRFSAELVNETIDLYELLPFFQNITDKILEIAKIEVKDSGKSVSCSSGCSACCHYLVPISKAEGMAILELIDSMPVDMQADVRARFAGNMAVLNETGLLESLEKATLNRDKEQVRAMSLAYFGLNLPCPFLQEHSCMIYQQRPLRCREYIVVSDPKYCSEPDPETVESLALPKSVSQILYALCRDDSTTGRGVMPMVQLLDSEESVKSGQPDPAPALEWVERFLRILG